MRHRNTSSRGKGATILSKAQISGALAIVVLAFAVVDSTALASQRATELKAQDTTAVTIAAPDDEAGRSGLQSRAVTVSRRGSPTIVFTDDSAVAFQLDLTRSRIRLFETALAKDLARGEFRAPHTQQAITAGGRRAAGSATAELGQARRELTQLKRALRSDLAAGDFHAPNTRTEVTRADPAPSGAGEAALASGDLSVSDDLWSLEAAVEKDLHAREFHAIETHFVIDGRRWKQSP